MATLTAYKYTLDPGSRKFRCPACERKRFVRYMDNETGDYLPDDIGRCDREIECSYHKPPRQADGIEPGKVLYSKPEPPKEPKASTLPYTYVEVSQKDYEANVFIQWLATLPGWSWGNIQHVAGRYKVGTSKDGWAIFWQIDETGKVRSGKMMKYDQHGHRVKNDYSQDWIHSKLLKSGKLENFELVQCFYGLHIVDDSKPVAIVESEKTVIICSQYLPQFHWLASGQLHGINEYKLRPLRGRNIVLFPDIGAFDLWAEKAKEYGHMANIQVSDLLEYKAPDQHKGYDLADYLIRFDLQEFLGIKASMGKRVNPITTSGYPIEMDSISPLLPGSFEDYESARAVIQDADMDELQEFCKHDPILRAGRSSFFWDRPLY